MTTILLSYFTRSLGLAKHKFIKIKAIVLLLLINGCVMQAEAGNYIWNGSSDQVLSTGTNWTPVRSVNGTSDSLIWPTGSWTVNMNTGNLTGTTGTLIFKSGSTVTLLP